MEMRSSVGTGADRCPPLPGTAGIRQGYVYRGGSAPVGAAEGRSDSAAVEA